MRRNKISIVIPVYFNQENLLELYNDIIEKTEANAKTYPELEYELVFVDDGSKDLSWEILVDIAAKDERVKIFRLSRNFGSHSAILCGLSKATGNCAIVKAADLQEPTELIFEMYESWKKGNNVVLAVRGGRPEKWNQQAFSNLYYAMVRKTALPQMPKTGFDVFLVDRKVIEVLERMDEKNSALTGQILWSGFKTDTVVYTRLERTAGTSRWTLKKKLRLVSDTLFSFTNLPISFVAAIGAISFAGSILWGISVLLFWLFGEISVSGWTSLFIFNLFSFGIIMLSIGILGSYLWRTFDATRKRPPYIVEESNNEKQERDFHS